ncbi:MAG: hypothetical protein C0506_09805 [Anaerolinea sp.]|nr:hypothetical protein [Anaerolinea sp.]
MRAFEQPRPQVPIVLTSRQQEVLRLLAAGRTNPEIAQVLGISLAGAKWHVSEVISRLGVTSREEAAEYWREQNRLPLRFTRAMRGLLGAGLLKTVAAGAAAATLGGGVVVAGAFLRSGEGTGAGDLAVEALAPSPTAVAPDLATKDGLTLRVVGTKIDDIQTTIEVVLEGRPELGRFASPAFTGAPGEGLRDQQGNVYSPRSMGGNATDNRFLSFTFDPLKPSATSLTLTLADAQFVDPASEVPEGQRPPDPSAVVAGPWVAEITGFAVTASTQVPVDHAPRPFGTAAVVIDEIRQGAGLTVVYARLVGFPEQDVQGLRLEWELIGQDGVAAAMVSGRGGDGPGQARIEWQFARTSGPATLRLRGHAYPPTLITGVEQFYVLDENGAATLRTGTVAEELQNESRRQRAEVAARVEAMLAGAPPAEWSVVLP